MNMLKSLYSKFRNFFFKEPYSKELIEMYERKKKECCNNQNKTN